MKRILLAAMTSGLFLATSVFAVDTTKPPTKGGPTAAPPAGGTGGSQNPGLFADAVGRAMPLLYCRAGEPCDVAVHFANVGAPLAANQAIPDPTWTIDGQAAIPTSVQRMGSGPGWATQEVEQWTARFTIPLGKR